MHIFHGFSFEYSHADYFSSIVSKILFQFFFHGFSFENSFAKTPRNNIQKKPLSTDFIYGWYSFISFSKKIANHFKRRCRFSFADFRSMIFTWIPKILSCVFFSNMLSLIFLRKFFREKYSKENQQKYIRKKICKRIFKIKSTKEYSEENLQKKFSKENPQNNIRKKIRERKIYEKIFERKSAQE